MNPSGDITYIFDLSASRFKKYLYGSQAHVSRTLDCVAAFGHVFSDPQTITERLDRFPCREENTLARSLSTAFGTTLVYGFTSYDPGRGFFLYFLVFVTHPRHVLGCRTHVRRGYIVKNAYRPGIFFKEGTHITPAKLFHFLLGPLLGVNCDPTLSSAEGHAYYGVLPCHVRRKRPYHASVYRRVKPYSALAGAAGVIMHNAVSFEISHFSGIQHYRDINLYDSGGMI